MAKSIRIGSRKSPLALEQAQQVAKRLKKNGIDTEIITIDSAGDIDLVQPIYDMGITGVFTKNLDIALLNHEIDIAVHSLKDIPTQLPKGIQLAAVLDRDFPEDVMIWKNERETGFENAIIGTGSLRRTAFLLHHESSVKCENIRGNIQTRLEKLNKGEYKAIVLSLAGIKRMKMQIPYEVLPFMTPAAGQGVVAITSLENTFQQEMEHINSKDTFSCITVERDFLNTLEGGCSAPIGAHAKIKENLITFEGVVLSIDGSQKLEVQETFGLGEYTYKGKQLAEKLLGMGAADLIEKLPKNE